MWQRLPTRRLRKLPQSKFDIPANRSPDQKVHHDLGIALEGYQRLRQTTTPPGRSVFGRASLTVSVRPSTCLPLRAAIALTASPSSLMSTNPNPLACPDSRSVIMLTRSTSVGFKKPTENSFRDGSAQVSNQYAFHMLKVFPVVANGHQVGASLVCVRAIRLGVSEPLNSAQKYSPTSGHHP